MKYLSTRIVYAIALYVLIMTLIFVKKPLLLFTEEGDIRPFGFARKDEPPSHGIDRTPRGHTIYSLGVLTVALAIISFYFFCVVDIIFED